MIDLRKEIAQLLNDYGYKVLLQRTSRKIHCRCWDPNTNEADPRCRYCGGTGWVNRMETHKVSKDPGSLPVNWSSRNKETDIGKQLQDATVYYMTHDSHPKVGDVIYEVGWNESNRPTHIVKASEIRYSYPHRGDNGRIEYFQVACSNKVMDISFQSVHIRKIGMLFNYEPVVDQ